MRGSTWVRVSGAAVTLMLLATACGGDGEDTTTVEPTVITTPTEVIPTPEATEADAEPEPADDGKDREEIVGRPSPTPTPTPAPTAAPPTAEPLSGTGDDMGVGGATTYGEYVVVADDTGAITVEVPTEWAQVDGRPYADDAGREFFDVRASNDLEAFATGWEVPGIIVNASTDAAQSQNEVALLDERQALFSQACTYLGREPYDDGLYTGQFDVYERCGGTETGYIIIGAVPTSRAFLIRVEVQVTQERDLEALQRAIASFVIVGDV